MSDLDHKQYQDRAFLELTQIIQTQKIANAWLFFGNENTRRKEAAFFLAKGCNCMENNDIPCNKCKSCRKIDTKNHPDILSVDLEKDKKIVSIDQIRKIGLKITSKPNEAKYRVVLILNADKMNTQSQNALLKMIEEPPLKTFFILIAQKCETLLPTIISRCRKIRFKPLSYNNIEQNLIKNFNIDRQMAYIAARTSDADLKKAMMYLNLSKEKISDKKKALNKKSLNKKPLKEIDWIKKRSYLIKTLADIILTNNSNSNSNSISKGLMLSQKISLDISLIDDTLAIMKTFFRDLMIFQYSKYQLVNLDFSDTLQDISLKMESNQMESNQMESNQVTPNQMTSNIVFDWLENLFEAQKKINANSTPRLVLDSFFLKIAQQAVTRGEEI